MMGERTVAQEALFYKFSLERHVPASHLLRSVERFVDLSGIRAHLRPFYSEIGRPSIDPELMIRIRIVGYCFGIRSERRLCDEVHPNLAYRWFCRLGLEGDVPDHSIRCEGGSGKGAGGGPTFLEAGRRKWPIMLEKPRSLSAHESGLQATASSRLTVAIFVRRHRRIERHAGRSHLPLMHDAVSGYPPDPFCPPPKAAPSRSLQIPER